MSMCICRKKRAVVFQHTQLCPTKPRHEKIPFPLHHTHTQPTTTATATNQPTNQQNISHTGDEDAGPAAAENGGEGPTGAFRGGLFGVGCVHTYLYTVSDGFIWLKGTHPFTPVPFSLPPNTHTNIPTIAAPVHRRGAGLQPRHAAGPLCRHLPRTGR